MPEVRASSRMKSMAALWLRMSRTAGRSEASGGARSGPRAGTEFLLVYTTPSSALSWYTHARSKRTMNSAALGVVGEKLRSASFLSSMSW